MNKTRSGKKILITLLLLVSAVPVLESSNSAKATWKISGVELVISDKVTDYWNGVTYGPADNDDETGRYINILNRELLLYPEGYLKKANVKRIITGRDLAFSGQFRAAVPDPYNGSLYLSVNGAYGCAAEYYLVHCIHHELHHLVEFAIWKNMRYDWPEWIRLNTRGFTYGTGGETAYTDFYTDYYSATHPHRGFLNLYSMTGDEEDRAEIIAYMMSTIERPILIAYCREDSILLKKVKLAARLVNEFAGKKFIDITPFLSAPGKTSNK